MPAARSLCAVLVVGSPVDDTGDAPLGLECPLHLTPLLGKNPLVYAVETLVACGIRHIICLGWEDPAGSQEALGDGQRWGCEIEWHSLSGPQQVFERLVDVAPSEAPFLLANTLCLMWPTLDTHTPPSGTVFVSAQPDPEVVPTVCAWDWAWLACSHVRELARSGSWPAWGPDLRRVCAGQQTVRYLALHDGSALLQAIEPMLMGQFPVVIDGNEIEPGVFVSRNVMIHPTVQIHAPLYIGANAVLSAHCRVGPAVAIGQQSHVGPDCEISQAQIGPSSWLGASLDVKASVVWRGIIWSEPHQARMSMVDTRLLAQGASVRQWRRKWVRQTGRLAAGLLWLLLLPLWVLGLAHQRGHRGNARICLVDPVRAHLAQPTRTYVTWWGATPQSRGWRHAMGFVLPNLGAVALGRCCLVGLRLRSPEQWARLPHDHQRWLAGRPSGLIQEECLVDMATDDVLQSMVIERFQHMRSSSLLYAWGLIGRYLRQLLPVGRRRQHTSVQGKPQWN